MSDFNEHLFTRVCTLEATLELNTKKLYETEQKLVEIEKLLRQALEVIIDTNKVANGIQETNRSK
jgi:precorrin isomerase